MFTTFHRDDLSSRDLYFLLSNSLQITSAEKSSPQYKFAGIYAIFKKGICYYVGQSQNLASRISQHISGKYSSADLVMISMPTSNGFSDFYQRQKESRKAILENNEKAFIRHLKPIENLELPDPDFDISPDQTFKCLLEIIKDDTSGMRGIDFDAYICLDNQYISCSDSFAPHLHDCAMLSSHNEYIIDCAKHLDDESLIKEFCHGKS